MLMVSDVNAAYKEYYTFYYETRSQDTSVGIVMGCRVEFLAGSKDFSPVCSVCDPALGSIQLPLQWVLRDSFHKGKMARA
jgi:hypothetical protein